jgi:hypothetical protein
VRRRAVSRDADDAAALGAAGGSAGEPADAAQREKKAPRRRVAAGLQERGGGGAAGGGSRVGHASAGGGAARMAASAVSSFPMQALTAVNDVLFLRHGYHRMDRHGDPRWAHYVPSCSAALHFSTCLGAGCIGTHLC